MAAETHASLQGNSLEHAPQCTEGYFDCGGNKLTNLVGAPQSVGGSYYCNLNLLTSLVGAPKAVGGDFHCEQNQLVGFEGLCQVDGKVVAHDNPLVSLDNLPKGIVVEGVPAAVAAMHRAVQEL